MSKTREIEVSVEADWINETGRIGLISEATTFRTRLNGKDTVKARLIIELPERKIEITEAQFDEAVKSVEFTGWQKIPLDELKAKLFGRDV